LLRGVPPVSPSDHIWSTFRNRLRSAIRPFFYQWQTARKLRAYRKNLSCRQHEGQGHTAYGSGGGSTFRTGAVSGRLRSGQVEATYSSEVDYVQAICRSFLVKRRPILENVKHTAFKKGADHVQFRGRPCSGKVQTMYMQFKGKPCSG
jgi:hypothetical protein